jgi:hypothetical protein
MEQSDFRKFHSECDQWIRTGQIALAKKALTSIKSSEVPSNCLRDLCNLYRRALMWRHSLSALKAKVRPEIGKSKASVDEVIEYALALQKAGAYRESQNLLNEPNVKDEPQALMARAFHEIFHWNYQDAEPLWEAYLAHKDVGEYEKLVARVNRLAGYCFLRDPRITGEFERLKSDLSGNPRLLAAVLEIGAQHLIMDKQWKEAEAALSEAEKVLGGQNGREDLMFVDKWRAVTRALTENSVKPLDQFRERALGAKHWETLRDLDYFRATIIPDSPWSEWVYYGTPYPAYRRRLDQLRDFNEQETVSRSRRPAVIVDPWYVGNQHGETTHLLFNLLLRDFYRPMKIGEIFSELFWDGFWDAKSSQNRVHQLIRRLRSWIEKNELPLSILEVEGSYSLRINQEAGLICRKRILPAQKLPFIFGRYYSQPAKPLAALEWADRLKVTPAKARYLLSQALPAGLLDKVGRGARTRYSLRSF